MKLNKILIALTMGLLSTQVFADESSVTNLLKQKYPELPNIEVQKSQAPGLYQVIIENNVAYTDENVNYLFLGGNILMKNGGQTVRLAPNLNKVVSQPTPGNGTDLNTPATENKTTETAKNNVDKNTVMKDTGHGTSKIYSNLPFENAVKLTYGKGERQIALFVDPDCPFCQALDPVLVKNADELNATVYMFYFPLKIHPQATEKAEFLWCQADKEGAWKSWMAYTNKNPIDGSNADAVKSRWENWKKESGYTSEVAGCDKSVVAKTAELSRGLGLNSTPVILFKNSIQLPGYNDFLKIKQGLDLADRFPVVPQLEESIVVPGVLQKN